MLSEQVTETQGTAIGSLVMSRSCVFVPRVGSRTSWCKPLSKTKVAKRV